MSSVEVGALLVILGVGVGLLLSSSLGVFTAFIGVVIIVWSWALGRSRT